MADINRLQLHRGGKVYATRDLALQEYRTLLNVGFEAIPEGSPTLLYYAVEDSVNIILAIGLPEGKTYKGEQFFYIDTTELQEQITAIDTKYDDAIEALNEGLANEATAREEGDEALNDKIEENKASIDELIAKSNLTTGDIADIVKACGLTFNDKLDADRIQYAPKSKIDMIDDANDIIDALTKLAVFAQEVSDKAELAVVDSDTVDFTIANAEKGKSISADVRIAGANGLSKRIFDNNILGSTTNGLYAAVSLVYNKDTDELTLQTSGYDANGEFKVDIYGEPIKLQNHTEYKGDNGQQTGVKVTVDNQNLELSAKLNLSTDSENILKLENGTYVVKGTAQNIKYGNTTVDQALASQSEKIEGLLDKKTLGSSTDTVDVTLNQVGDNTTIAAQAKLSSDNSIVVKNGGLAANVSAFFTKATNTLTISVGDKDYAIDMTTMGISLLKNTRYDSTTEELILTFDVNGTEQNVVIPLSTLIHDLDTEDTDAITLKIRSVLGGPNILKATLKVDNSHADNILTVNANGAYVSESHITNAVQAEKLERTQAIQNLKTATEVTDANLQGQINTIASSLAEANDKFAAKGDSYLKGESDAKFATNEGLTNAVNMLNANLLTKAEASSKYATKTALDNITLQKKSNLEYELYVDGVNKGTITIPKDNFLKSVVYNPTTKTLDFTFTTSDSTTPSYISVAMDDLIDVYTAGYGLTLVDNKFALDKDLTMSKEAVQAELAKKANTTDVYPKADTDAKFLTQINASEIYTSKTYADNTYTTKLAMQQALTEYSKTTDIVNQLNEKANAADVYTKDETNTTYLSKADAAQTYLSKIDATQQYATKDEVALKANAADVYTKLEVKKELDDYALTTDVDSKLANKANTADVANVYATKEALNTLTQDAATKDEVQQADEAIQALVDANETAIGNINLSYNPATSVLSFTNKDGVEKEYQLYSGSLIKGGHFDEATNSIVLEISTSGVESQVVIPVSDLLSDITKDIEKNATDIEALETAITKLANSWNVTDSNTVNLTKTTVGAQDNLTAEVRIASSNKQAIQTGGDGLYVSNDLEDFTVVFGAEGTISGQDAISKLLDADNVMKNQISTFDNRITQNANNITTLQTQVAANTQNITNLTTRLGSLETKVNTMETALNNLTVLVEQIIGGGTGQTLPEIAVEIVKIKNATGYDTYTNTNNMSTRLDTLEGVDAAGRLTNIENNLIGDKDNPTNGSIWYELNNNIVDAGTY